MSANKGKYFTPKDTSRIGANIAFCGVGGGSVATTFTISAVTSYIFTVPYRKLRVMRASVQVLTVPGAAAGSIVFVVSKYDATVTNSIQNLTSAINLNSLTAAVPFNIPFKSTVTDQQLIISEGQSMLATVDMGTSSVTTAVAGFQPVVEINVME